MKIIEIQIGGAKEWLYSPRKEDAIEHYLHIAGVDLSEIDDVAEVPQSEWKDRKITFYDEPGQPQMSFEEYVHGLTDNETLIIASTEW